MRKNEFEEKKYYKMEDNQSSIYSVSRGQKIAVAVLAFFVFVIVIIWSIQFKKSLNEPFEYKGGEKKQKSSVENIISDNNEEESQLIKDTDGDGLTDWDELNIYKTSPYLEDSDSDGYSDKQEIDSGNDPDCPAGRDCYGINKMVEKKIEVADNDNVVENVPAGVSVKDSSELEMLKNMDVATLREMLIQSGVDKAMIDQISDEELMMSFEEVMKDI